MFKIGDKVFDNERGYGEGVIKSCQYNHVFVDFKEVFNVSYTFDGRWLSCLPVTLFKKEEMKNYYHVGQKVSHQGFGDGIVESIDSEITGYPIMVAFERVNKSFTLDGRYNVSEHPSLSQKPHVPLELEEVVYFEKGELVWVKIGDIWDARYYSHFDGEFHCFFLGQNKSGSTFQSLQTRKFSNNPLL